MQVQVQTNLLIDSLTKAYSIIERRSSIPVLSYVLLTADEDRIIVRTTDLNHSLADIIDAEVTTPGSVLVQAQTLYEILRKSESEMMQLHFVGDELLVRSNTAEFRLTTLNPEEFPETPKIDNEKSLTVPAKEFKRLLDLTHFSMSTDETRYNLSGVYIHNEGQKIIAVATDAHRLALVESENTKGFNEQRLSMILSRKTVLEYRKLLDEKDGDASIDFNNIYVSLTLGNTRLQSRLVDATFPEYTHIIPKTSDDLVVTLDRKMFIDAINRISIVADEKSPLVKFNLSAQKLTISSNSPNKGKAEESMSVDYKLDECNLGFNPRYIIDIATNLSSKDIRIYFKDSLSAIIVKGVGSDSALFMVMPMLVN